MEDRLIETNGIRLHATVAGEGPLALMVHGFPGVAWSWRHQLPALAEAGFTAVAVDTRGYGGSDRPDDGYTTDVIEQDLLGVIDAFGVEQAVVIGQDFGAKYAWNLARHHPSRVRAVAGTVPFADLAQDRPPTEVWQELSSGHFLHLHYFQAVGVAERDLGGPHLEEFLKRLLWALSGEGGYFSVFGHRSEGTSYLDALPPAPPLPWRWLSEADFATYVEGFRRGPAGAELRGGLGAYRAADADWRFESAWLGQPITQPALLFLGEHDPVRKFVEVDRSLFPDLTEVVVPDAGHHVQQEQPAAVNAALTDWLQRSL